MQICIYYKYLGKLQQPQSNLGYLKQLHSNLGGVKNILKLGTCSGNLPFQPGFFKVWFKAVVLKLFEIAYHLMFF